MNENDYSENQLEKLAKNPHYKMSTEQQALLAQYRAKKFKNNPNFAKHPNTLEEKPDGQPDSN